MYKFAVGYLDFYDNDLIIEIIEAEDWKSALFKHSKLQNSNWNQDDFGETLEKAKIFAFNCDMMVDVIKID